MTDPELRAEGPVSLDFIIEFGDQPFDGRYGTGFNSGLLSTPGPPALVELRCQGDEGKSPAEREIDERQRTVSPAFAR